MWVGVITRAVSTVRVSAACAVTTVVFSGCTGVLVGSEHTEVAPSRPIDIQVRLVEPVVVADPAEAPDTAYLEVVLRLPENLVKGHEIELPFWNEAFREADGYGAFVSGDMGIQGVVRYRVSLDHAAKGPDHGLDEVPHRTSRGWVWVGRAFVPIVKVDGQVRSDLATTLTIDAAGLAGETRYQGSLGALTHRFYVFGPLNERVVTHGQASVRIVSADFDGPALEPLALLVKAALVHAEGALGQAPRGTRLLIYDRQAQGFAGGVIGGDVSLLSSTPPSVSALSPIGTVVVHELIHLWIHGDVPWLSEGLTSYFELVLGLSIDKADTRATALELSRLLMRHESQGIGAHPVRHAEGLAAYTGGALVGLCLAARLKAVGHSLGSVIEAAAPPEPGNTNRNPLTLNALRDSLMSVAPEVNHGLDALLDAGPGELGRCVEETGYSVMRRPYLGYSLKALVVDVLGITSFSPQRAEVFRVRTGSVFEPGDIVLSVAGRPIVLMPEIDLALVAVKAGTNVPVVVERAGVELGLTLVVPEVPMSSREGHNQWVVEPHLP